MKSYYVHIAICRQGHYVMWARCLLAAYTFEQAFEQFAIFRKKFDGPDWGITLEEYEPSCVKTIA